MHPSVAPSKGRKLQSLIQLLAQRDRLFVHVHVAKPTVHHGLKICNTTVNVDIKWF